MYEQRALAYFIKMEKIKKTDKLFDFTWKVGEETCSKLLPTSNLHVIYERRPLFYCTSYFFRKLFHHIWYNLMNVKLNWIELYAQNWFLMSKFWCLKCEKWKKNKFLKPSFSSNIENGKFLVKLNDNFSLPAIFHIFYESICI